jgi:hypothetical protein
VKRMIVMALGVVLAFVLGDLHARVPGQAAPRMSAEAVLDHRTDALPTPTRVRVMHNRWEPGAETVTGRMARAVVVHLDPVASR